MNFLVIGHGRHGKDTVGEMLAALTGRPFASSSEFAAQKAVFPLMVDQYETWQDCYADRANFRELWFHAIAAYNLRPGPSLAEQVLAEHGTYVGMRKRREFESTRHLFDQVIWVDRSDHLPLEPMGSMELTAGDADFVMDNNGDLLQLQAKVAAFVLLAN
ncbi:MAG: hypothetical protein JKY31_08445 [Rhodobacteraceae bacterium]|nr:hypothetical protein [Paracoccaceae bacterium]